MSKKRNHTVFKLQPALAGLLFAFSAGASMQAYAGLGALRVLSGADEAFYAEVPVDPEPGLLAPAAALASLEQYPMLGPYSDSAKQLSIRTNEVEPGHYVIVLSGPVLAREDNMHFALELSWASGRAIREYQISGNGQPLPVPEKKPASHSILPAEKPSFISGANGLAFGDGRLLSVRGVPLRMEFELLGDWPATSDIARHFQLSGIDGLADGAAAEFSIRQRSSRRWLQLTHPLPVLAPRLSFDLSVRLGDAVLNRHFSVAVPKAGKRYRRATPSDALPVDGYRVKAGDSLSRLAQRYGKGTLQAWQDKVVAQNPQAFAGGDRDLLLSGAWLVFPGSDLVAPKPATSSRQISPSAPLASTPDADAASTRLLAQRLKEAQQRMQWLENEIRRLDSHPHTPASTGKLTPLSEVEEKFLDGHLTEWVLTGVGGISIASLLAWALLRRRRQKPEKLHASSSSLAQVIEEPVIEDDFNTPVSLTLPATTQQLAAEVKVADALDVLAESEVLLACGRVSAAEDLLRNALQAAPEREDVRMSLLSLLAAKGEKQEFEMVALDVLAVFGAQSALWERVQQLGASIDPANPLYHQVQRSAGSSVLLTPEVSSVVSGALQARPRPAADFAASDPQPVSIAAALPEQVDIAELVQLYREMGDSEAADALLRESGLLEAPKEAVDSH